MLSALVNAVSEKVGLGIRVHTVVIPIMCSLALVSLRAEDSKPLPDDRLVAREAFDIWDPSFTPETSVLSEEFCVAKKDPIELFAAGNEVATAAVMVQNPSSKDVYAKVSLSPANTNASENGTANIVLREALHIRCRLGQLVADILPRIAENGLISVPAGETRQIWMEFNTEKLSPGTYKYTLNIQGEKGVGSTEIPLEVTVMDFELPRKLPIAIYTWDGNLKSTKGEVRKQLMAEMRSHYVNVFHFYTPVTTVFDGGGNIVEGPEFTLFDELAKSYGTDNTYIMYRDVSRLMGNVLTKDGKWLKIGSEPWRNALRAYLKVLYEHIEKLGFTKEQLWLYPVDESPNEVYLELASELHNIDPGMNVFVNPWSYDKYPMEFVRTMVRDNQVSVLCVKNTYMELTEFPALQKEVQTNGGKLTFYNCPSYHKRLSPAMFYKSFTWIPFIRGLDGAGYWTSLGIGGSDDNHAFDDFIGNNPSSVTIYTYADEVIPSRRWQGFRAGGEGFAYLEVLRQLYGGDRAKVLNLVGIDTDKNNFTYNNTEKYRQLAANEILELKGKTTVNFPPFRKYTNRDVMICGGADTQEPGNIRNALKTFIEASKYHASLPAEIGELAATTTSAAKELLEKYPDKDIPKEELPSDLEQIVVIHNGTLNPESISDKLSFTLYNIALPYSQWVRIQAKSDNEAVPLKLYIVRDGKRFEANEADCVQVAKGNDPVSVEVELDDKYLKHGKTTVLAIFPLDHRVSGSARYINVTK